MRKYILTAVFFAVPAMAHAASLETIETGINTAVESENVENAHGITASIFDGAKTGGKDVVAVNAAGGEKNEAPDAVSPAGKAGVKQERRKNPGTPVHADKNGKQPLAERILPGIGAAAGVAAMYAVSWAVAPEIFVWSALAGGAAGAIAAAVRGGDATEIIEDGLRGFALGFVALPVLGAGAGALLAKLF